MSLKYRIKVIDDVSLLIFFFNKVNFSYQYSFKMIYLYIFSYLQNYKQKINIQLYIKYTVNIIWES